MKIGPKNTIMAAGGCFGVAAIGQLLGQLDFRNVALVSGLLLVLILILSILLSPKS